MLVRESMSPDNRLQAILQGDNPRARMIADTHPDGSTRGLIQLPADVKEMPIGEKGLLQIARTLHNGSLHQGVVQVPSRVEQRVGGVHGVHAGLRADRHDDRRRLSSLER